MFKLKNKFFIYPYILLFALFNYFPLLNLQASQGSTDKKLTVDFFDQLPANDYILGPGDTLNIIISRDIGLTAVGTIDGEGTITLPKLERIYISGLTINELNSLLNEAYSEFIKYPKVATTITNYRRIRVFVEGEVVNPGLQTLEGSLSSTSTNKTNGGDNISIFQNENSGSVDNNNYYFPTVFDAIRASGGITQFSNLKNVQVIRKDSVSNGSGKISTTINFEDVLRFGDTLQNIRIYDSDVIKVQKNDKPNNEILTKGILSKLNPKFINVFVSGRVNRPGTQLISRAGVLSDAIDMAGGAKIMRGPVTFIRFESNGNIDKRKLRFTKKNRGKYNNPNLRDGDLIIVGDSVITSTNEVLKEITSPLVGIFSTYGLIKAISD